MNYSIYQPAPILRPYIDMYWQMRGRLSKDEKITLMPEGGINLCANLGDEIQCINATGNIKHEDVLLVGPMMKTSVQLIRNEVILFGIRFKPGAFSYFYKYESLDQVANLFHEFPRKDFPEFKNSLANFSNYLDLFFRERLSPPKFSILNCLADIYQNVGSINIEALAKKHFTSPRQLERQFNQQIGLPPKKFVDLERFLKAFSMLNINSSQSMQDIAWNCGYYDHAHLTNDFKRFTGQPPTAFILSDFSKKVASEAC